MSILAEFRAAERALQAQMAQLEALKNDTGLQKEIEFETKLRELMASYGKSLKDIIAIIDPAAGRRQSEKPKTQERRARTLKKYENPHTGEVIETKGGNHRALKEWKTTYGADTVESWRKA